MARNGRASSRDVTDMAATVALTSEEDLRHAFQQFDTNGDGKISPSELRALLARLGDNVSEGDAVRMVQDADTDGDGFIDFQEFVRANTAAASTSDADADADELRSVFRMFDEDGNGFISPEELHRILSSLSHQNASSLEECRAMIQAVDRNNDGLVDFEEFKTLMTKPLPLHS